MKTMFLCDLVTMRRTLWQITGSVLLALLIITVATRSLLAGPVAIAILYGFMYLSSVFALDESNGWASYRLTLPLTRRSVMLGRYASVFAVTLVAGAFIALLVAAFAALWPHLPPHITSLLVQEKIEAGSLMQLVVLLAAILLIGISLAVPFIVRFGVTKGSRVITLVLLVLPSLGIAQFGDQLVQHFSTFLTSSGPLLLFVVSLVLYVLSALVAVRLYETREL